MSYHQEAKRYQRVLDGAVAVVMVVVVVVVVQNVPLELSQI